MDIVTHGLASLAVARGFFPRAGKAAIICAILAGAVADVDWLSQYRGPSTFLAWHGTYTHSIVAIFFFVGMIPSVPLVRHYLQGDPAIVESRPDPRELLKDRAALTKRAQGRFLAGAAAASFCAALLHILMDACQTGGVTLFLPFSSRRFSADWLPSIDPWIVAILIACIALPELLRLVSSEIGAKSKKARGQTGALIGLALVLVYTVARATLHSNALATMESRTFHGETPRRVSAFPETLSILTWHGVVETDSALNQMDVDAASASKFDADSSLRLFKPDSSPTLDAARNTVAARKFLATAHIPRASVEKTETGYIVVLRDLRYAASGETQHEVAARIELDLNNQVKSADLVWARDLIR